MTKQNPTGVRLDPIVLEQIKDLAAWWGPVKRLSLADVVREAVRRCHEAEKAKRKPKRGEG